VLLAGSVGKTGAAVLAAQAAMRCGAGLVTVATSEKAQPHLAAHLLETMSVPLPDTNGGLGRTALQQIIDLCEGKTVLAMGPGLGNTDAIAAIIRTLVTTIPLPMVIDADALNALAHDPQVLSQASGPVVLTPHPGEMARLTGLTSGHIQSDRIGSACRLAKRLNCIIVLKGAHTVIAAPDGRHWINTSGNPAMAGAGMGDTLTGMIAGLIAQRVPPLDAARLAVCMHGGIADRLVQKRGPAPIMASEIIDHIPEMLIEYIA
jgi:NAD(P)H-hydrate epimerase